MVGRTVVIELHGITHGGEAVGRLEDGRAVFVAHALPTEQVQAVVTEAHRRWARARLVSVERASPDRVVPPCPYTGPEQPGGPPRCGGCALQHAAPSAQATLKHRIVTEQLARIGQLTDVPVAAVRQPASDGYRNRARMGVTAGGTLGFRRPSSDQLVAIDRCLVLHPRVQALRDLAGDAWNGCSEVTLRAGLQGDGAVVVATVQATDAIPELPDGDAGVVLVGTDGQAAPLREPTRITEVVAGIEMEVPATAFFQASTAAAEVLVELVRGAVDVQPGETVVDAYAGVGLFATALARDGATVVAIEGDPVAAASLQVNLDGADATVVAGDVTEGLTELLATGTHPAAIVLDPPRRGATPDVLEQVALLAPARVCYVSCDPAAFARDARILVDAGYELEQVSPVDQFAHTAQIELVGAFRRR